MTPLRWKPLLAAGLCSGLLQVVAGVATYVAGVYFAPWSGFVSLALLAAAVVFGLRWYVTHVLDRRTTYVGALFAGVTIAVVTGLVYVVYNFISVSLLYPHFLDDMAQARFAAQANGLDPARATDLLASLRASTTLSGVIAANLRGFCVLGTAISALAALGFLYAFPPRPGGAPIASRGATAI